MTSSPATTLTPRVRELLSRTGPLILAMTALVLWLIGLRPVDVTGLDGLGLIGVLSPLTVLAIPIVVAACLLEVHRTRRRTWVLTFLTALLIVTIFGIQPSVESAARIPQGWLHIGFTEYIVSYRATFVLFDARFSWPGFFVGLAYAASAAGVDHPDQLLMWAPVVLQMLTAVVGRALIVTILGTTTVTSWYATWILLVANWSEQDYLAPQAIALILFLGTLALVVRFLVNSDLLSPRPSAVAPRATRSEQFFISLAVPVLGATLVVSHQVTPLALIGVLGVLWITRRINDGWPAVILAMTFVTYFVLGARAYWSSRLTELFSGVGDVSEIIGQGIFERSSSSDAMRQLIIGGRIGLTLAVAALAVVGYVVLWRRRGFSAVLPLMALAAGAVALVQPYGGEILIRAYIYVLAFAAVGGAIALCEALHSHSRVDMAVGMPGDSQSHPSRQEDRAARPSALRWIIAWVILSVFAVATITTRGGNDAFVGITQNDVNAVQWVYAEAGSGDTMMAPYWQPPMLSDRIEDVRQLSRSEIATEENPCSTEDEMMRCLRQLDPDFVILSPQQDAAGRYTGDFAPGWIQRLQDQLIASGTYEVGHVEGNVTVLAKVETAQ